MEPITSSRDTLYSYTKNNLENCFKEDKFKDLPDLLKAANSPSATDVVQGQMRQMIHKHRFAKKIHKLLSPISQISASTFDKMERFEKTYEALCNPQNPYSAYDLFLKENGRRLGISFEDLTLEESRALAAIKVRLWDFATRQTPEKPYPLFKSLMTTFYQGEHFVFFEDIPSEKGKEKASRLSTDENDMLYDALKFHGYLRGSSHYDHGTLNGATGGPVPISPEDVKNPQYGIDGPHLKHLCFGRAILLSDESKKTYFGKTEEDVLKETKKAAESFSRHQVTWLQTEGAPDSSSFFTRNFWRHRVRDFTLYFFRKNILHSEKPNVGPYGYGHGDNNPTVIDLRSPATK